MESKKQTRTDFEAQAVGIGCCGSDREAVEATPQESPDNQPTPQKQQKAGSCCCGRS